MRYRMNYSNPRKYGAILDDSSDGRYTIEGYDTTQYGAAYIQWSDYSEEDKDSQPHWSLTIEGLFWESVGKARWDDEAGVKALVELMANREQLYTQAALLYPERMAVVTAKMTYHKELNEWKIASLPGQRLPAPTVTKRIRRGSKEVPGFANDRLYLEKTLDGFRLVIAYEEGNEESYNYEELDAQLKISSDKEHRINALLEGYYEARFNLFELLDPVKYAQASAVKIVK